MSNNNKCTECKTNIDDSIFHKSVINTAENGNIYNTIYSSEEGNLNNNMFFIIILSACHLSHVVVCRDAEMF